MEFKNAADGFQDMIKNGKETVEMKTAIDRKCSAARLNHMPEVESHDKDSVVPFVAVSTSSTTCHSNRNDKKSSSSAEIIGRIPLRNSSSSSSRQNLQPLQRDSRFLVREHSHPLFKRGISSSFYPQKLCVQLDKIVLLGAADLKELPSNWNSLWFDLKLSMFSFTSKGSTPYADKAILPLSYHTILFDTVKFNLYNGKKRIAQAAVKLCDLQRVREGAFMLRLPLRKKLIQQPSMQFVKWLSASSVVDKIFEYHPKSSRNSYGTENGAENLDQNDDNTVGHVSLIFQFFDFCTNAVPDVIDDYDARLATDSYTNDNIELSTVPLADLDQSFYNIDACQCQKPSCSCTGFSSNASEDSASTCTSTSSSLKSSVDPSLIYSKSSFKAFRGLVASFFKTGCSLPAKDAPKAFSLLGRYYRHYSTPKSRVLVEDPLVLQDALAFLKYSIPSYGGVARKVFGHGSFRDVLLPNKKVILEHLDLPSSCLLEWQYDSWGLFSAKPCFFVVHDVAAGAVVVVIRGSWTMADIMTDAQAEYVPFMGGTAHGGILKSALWIRDHYKDKIKMWVRERGVQQVYFTGHSLGGSIAAVLLMLLRDELAQMECPSITGGLPKKVSVRAVAFAAAPSVSPDLIDPFKDDIITYINKHDPIPLLSYGSLMDLKEMLVHASSIAKTPGVKNETEELECLWRYAEGLRRSNKHPRLLVPGNLYFMYKTEESSLDISEPPSPCNSVSEGSTVTETSSVSSSTSSRPSSFLFPQSVFSASKRTSRREEKHHYVVEEAIAEQFDHLHLKFNMMYHHFPSMYENSLKKALLSLEK